MARPVEFTKKSIVDAATDLVAREGIRALTARSVAAEMRGSTAPIYGAFDSIDGLREAVIEQAAERLRHYVRRPWSDRPFLNEGTGLVVFAREHPRLFALLFLTPDVAGVSVPRIYADLLADMRRDARFADLRAREREIVLEKLWFLALGMATLAHAGQLRDPTDAGITSTLREAGNALIPAAIGEIVARRRKA